MTRPGTSPRDSLPPPGAEDPAPRAAARAGAEPAPAERARPVLGVSTCLVGRSVRMNGGHCRDGFLVDLLGPYVELRPVCPEVELGLGVPRPALRLLAGEGGASQLVVSKTGEDLTNDMREFAARRLEAEDVASLDGWVLKKASPTCGVFRVKRYDENGVPQGKGRGLFAEAVLERFPSLAVEEEGRLNDPRLRENFIVRIFTRARWRELRETDATPRALVAFHARHKLLLLAHDPKSYGEMGRLVADAGRGDVEERIDAYGVSLMKALSRPASRGRHVNAMQHLAGFVSKEASAEDRRELGSLVDAYRRGLVPVIVPLTLLRHLLRRHEAPAWAREQTYLDPYPAELMLRNLI